jgi:DNA repair protein RadC
MFDYSHLLKFLVLALDPKKDVIVEEEADGDNSESSLKIRDIVKKVISMSDLSVAKAGGVCHLLGQVHVLFSDYSLLS